MHIVSCGHIIGTQSIRSKVNSYLCQLALILVNSHSFFGQFVLIIFFFGLFVLILVNLYSFLPFRSHFGKFFLTLLK